MVIPFSTKCFLFVYIYIDVLKLKAYKLFENSDADLSWLLFNPFPNKPWFLRVCNTRLLKTLREKKKLLVTSNFSVSHSVFSPSGKLSAIFIKFEIVVCKLFQFTRV